MLVETRTIKDMTECELKESIKYSAHLLLSVAHSGARIDDKAYTRACDYVMAYMVASHADLLEDISTGDA